MLNYLNSRAVLMATNQATPGRQFHGTPVKGAA